MPSTIELSPEPGLGGGAPNSGAARAGMPPFRELLKSREVEDPVNLLLHRPLAYAFAKLVFPTPMTPNQVTLLAMSVGMLAGAAILVGSPLAMVLAGALLWTSSILDGADGILARAKNMQSQFGRALDGSADMIVAISTVLPVVWHLWVTTHDVFIVGLSVPIIVATVGHLYVYDYYKESYLRQTRLDRGGEGGDPHAVEQLLEPARERGRLAYLSVRFVLLPFVQAQTAVVARINPAALREGRDVLRSPVTAAIYRKHNRLPMQLWALVSLAPHSYLLAIALMADRVDLYFWLRLIVMNGLFVLAALLQRRATRLTQEEIAALAPA